MNVSATSGGANRPANFGQLNSAVARGDLEAAAKASQALAGSSAASAKSAEKRGSLDGVSAAVASGDAAAAKAALADFRAKVTPVPSPSETDANGDCDAAASASDAPSASALADLILSATGNATTTDPIVNVLV